MKLTLAVLALAFALIPAVVRAAELSVTPTTLLWNPGQHLESRCTTSPTDAPATAGWRTGVQACS